MPRHFSHPYALGRYCRYLRDGRVCFAGCTPQQIMCHTYFKHGACNRGDRCRWSHDLDSSAGPTAGSAEPSAGPSAGSAASSAGPSAGPSTSSTGSSAAPPARRSAGQLDRPEALRLLGLNPTGEYVTFEMVESMYRHRVKLEHPDKCSPSVKIQQETIMHRLDAARQFLRRSL